MTINDHRIYLESTQNFNSFVRGKVFGKNKAPVPYASVTLLNPQSGETINTGICNESGDFSVPFDSMRVSVKVTCIGYETFKGYFRAGDIGVIRLQPATYHLQPINVSQRRKRKQHQSKGYHRYAEKVRKTVWSEQDSCFDVTTVPDTLLEYPKVVVAQTQKYSYQRKFLFRPWYLFSSLPHNTLGTYRTTAISLKRCRILLNDDQETEKYAKLDYPRDVIMSGNQDKILVMGVKVIKPDGTTVEIETDEYTQPFADNEAPRPDHIAIEGLESGDIIDYFVWTEAKTFFVNPEPVLISIDNVCPLLNSRVSFDIDKNLNVQYRLINEADTLRMKSNDNGKLTLCADYKNLMPSTKGEKGYAVYVRDGDLKVNAPISTSDHQVMVNPDIHDVLTTKLNVYEKIRVMNETKEWVANSWNETDTTVVGAIVSNLSSKTPSKELLTEALYYQALRYPPYLIGQSHHLDGCEREIYLNREYTIMFARMLQLAGIPFHVAMTTKKDREDIDQLMDENNIVWMVRTDTGRCFIPRFDGFDGTDGILRHDGVINHLLVGQKARSVEEYHSFVINPR